jgi:hypothetical protein
MILRLLGRLRSEWLDVNLIYIPGILHKSRLLETWVTGVDGEVPSFLYISNNQAGSTIHRIVAMQ